MRRIALSLSLVLLLLLAACGGDEEVAIEDLDDDVDATEQDELDDLDLPDEEEEAADEEAEDDPPADEGDAEGQHEEEASEDDAAEPDPGPQPDPAEVADPCATRDEQAMEPFIDIASPVDGQRVLDSVELVGCAAVNEGTVRYRVVAEDGTELADDFTTAECGGPCVGEYSTVIDLAGAGADHDTVTLEVFWDSPAGEGSEEDLTEVELHLE